MKTNLIETILKTTNFKQVDLARELGVSRSQISIWKSNGCIPEDRQSELKNIAGISDIPTAIIELAQGSENESQWTSFATEVWDKTSYPQPPLEVIGELLGAIKSLGIIIESTPPSLDTKDPTFRLMLDYINTFDAFEDFYANRIADTITINSKSNGVIQQAEKVRQLIPNAVLLELEEKTSILSECFGLEAGVLDVMKHEKGLMNKFIYDYCFERKVAGLPIDYDYFLIAKGTSETISDYMRETRQEGTSGFLTHAERELLKETKKQTVLLEKLTRSLNL